jgi:hypothetical protein
METKLFEVIFYDGRKFNIFCSGKAQIKRFHEQCDFLENEIEHIIESVKGIHTISQFEILTTNNII